MNKLMYSLMLVALLVFAGCGQLFASNAKPSGDGLFSVSPTMKVRFAPGNLEYNSSKGYSFAAHQYDYGDLFIWGSGSDPKNSMADVLSFDDWGSHIGDGWRTLTKDEWEYILKYRGNATDKLGVATVCGVHGLVLLPDNFNGGMFIDGFYNDNVGFDRNVYDASSWADMEAAGAVFFPAAGLYMNGVRTGVGEVGSYWSSTLTPSNENIVNFMFFLDRSVVVSGEHRLLVDDMSVRLVQEVGSGKGTSREVSRKGTSREVSVKGTSREVSVKRATGDGLFSVSAGRKVRFAPGNLVYSGGYHFTAHQYDYGGLFGWGTGSNPTNTSTDLEDYPSFDDWGNHIAGGWRTLTKDEWQYVIRDRANAAAKRGLATVCGVHGMVLLPDNWSGGTFHAAFNGWGTNVYDASSWSEMEDAGAVFLPAAGWRCWGTELGHGCYWSSTPINERVASSVYLTGYGFVLSDYFGSRNYGLSVRLVQDY